MKGKITLRGLLSNKFGKVVVGQYLPLLFLQFLICLCNAKFVSAQTVSSEWEVFNEANSPLPNNTIRCLLVDNLDDLWIGTDNGLAHLSEGNWTIYNESNSGLSDNYVRALTADNSNNIWIGTVLGGMQKFDGTTWTTYNTANSDIPVDFIRSISIDQLGHKWVGTVEGLSYFNDTDWVTWTMANSPLLTNNITSVGVGLNNEKYIGTINGGLVYMDSSSSTIDVYYILNSGVPDNSVLTVQMDVLGKPWYASSAGGLFTDTGNQTWMAFNYSNSPMPTNSLTTMKLDPQNNFYMGSQQNGLIIRRSDQTWENYTTSNSELAENYILSLERNEYVWIGTYSMGLVRLKESFVGTDELGDVPDLKVFPNPVASNDVVHFNTPVNQPRITIVSADSKVVYDETFSGELNSFIFPEIKSGSYLMTLEEENRTSVIRMMVL